jgi:hypothetical protein
MLVSDWSISKNRLIHQMLVHLAKQLQRRRFLGIDQPETRIAYGSHVCLRNNSWKPSNAFESKPVVKIIYIYTHCNL